MIHCWKDWVIFVRKKHLIDSGIKIYWSWVGIFSLRDVEGGLVCDLGFFADQPFLCSFPRRDSGRRGLLRNWWGEDQPLSCMKVADPDFHPFDPFPWPLRPLRIALSALWCCWERASPILKGKADAAIKTHLPRTFLDLLQKIRRLVFWLLSSEVYTKSWEQRPLDPI